jgi:3-carboxy-cis,cis-muconate cycloisomerase
MASAFCDRDYLQALLDVELALAVAEAEVGAIPVSCVPDIRSVARAELYDCAELAAAAESDGNVVIPLVRKLIEAVASRNPTAARYVHCGATSQDIMDTALVLRLRSARVALHEPLTRVMSAAATLAREYITTPMPGRTWLQHASPTTFGLKAAGWLDMTGRCRARLDRAIDDALVVQCGGASGTLASLGDAGPAVAEALGRELGLRVPAMPWHTHRDRIADVAAAFGIACGALGKIGRDLTLLAQSEISEAFEQQGGGSSSMPHKRNPVHAVTAVAAAVRAPGLVATILAAMPQEHERAAGGWQAEWQTLADLIDMTRGSAAAIASALGDLRVDAESMRRHLEIRGGVAMAEALAVALLAHMPRPEAMAHVERLSRMVERDGRPLRELATADPEVSRWLSSAEIEGVLTPENFLGAAGTFVERVLQEWAT